MRKKDLFEAFGLPTAGAALQMSCAAALRSLFSLEYIFEDRPQVGNSADSIKEQRGRRED